MNGAQFETLKLVLVPLTPIHVGGGDEAQLLPEDYRLRDGALELVSARAVLAGLPVAQQTEMIRWVERDPAAAIEKLHERATEEQIAERIEIAPDSARELRKGGRRGQVNAFVRSGGRAFLPGSSLKGALRTAWLAALAKKADVRRARDSKDLERRAFALASGQRATDTDPMRDVMAADAELPEGATRIDGVDSWKRSGGEYGFDSVGQLHVERLRAVVDGDAPPVIETSLAR